MTFYFFDVIFLIYSIMSSVFSKYVSAYSGVTIILFFTILILSLYNERISLIFSALISVFLKNVSMNYLIFLGFFSFGSFNE